MKVKIYNWAGNREVDRLINPLGFGHNEIYHVYDLFELAKRFHNLGLNVMLPQSEGDTHIICLDHKHLFTQR